MINKTTTNNNNILKVFLITMGISFFIFMPFLILNSITSIKLYQDDHIIFEYLLPFLTMLKLGLTAIIGYTYFNLFLKNSNNAIIGALLYTFSGYSIYNCFFNPFNHATLVFPLLLISIELMIQKEKRHIFAIAVFICCSLNYHMFFEQVLFCTVYFFTRMSTIEFEVTSKKVKKLIFELFVGCLMSAFALIPFIVEYTPNLYLDYLIYTNLIPNALFPPIVAAQSLVSQSLFIPIFGIAGVISFFKFRGKHYIKYLLSICLIMTLLPFINSNSSWYNMAVLIMVLATVLVVEDDVMDLLFGLKISAVCIVVMTGVGVALKSYSTLLDSTSWHMIYVFVAILGLFSIFFLTLVKTKHRYFYRVTVAIISIMSIGYSLFIGGVGILQGHSWSYYDQTSTVYKVTGFILSLVGIVVFIGYWFISNSNYQKVTLDQELQQLGINIDNRNLYRRSIRLDGKSDEPVQPQFDTEEVIPNPTEDTSHIEE